MTNIIVNVANKINRLSKLGLILLHGNYFVQIDLITCDYELTKQEQEQIKKLIQVEMNHVKLNSKSIFEGFHVAPDLTWVDGVSSEHIDDFCNNIYDLIHKFHN